MAKRKTYHVSPSKKDGWQVKSSGSKKASVNTKTKARAVNKAKSIAKNSTPSQVVIHKKDGKIQTEHTYGQDPYPPRG